MSTYPLSVTCSSCGASAGQDCVSTSGQRTRAHRCRGRLALALAAGADPALDAHFPRLGPCGICGTPGLDQRHRMVDAIAGRLEAGEGDGDVAEDYGLPLAAMEAVRAWMARWPGAWS